MMRAFTRKNPLLPLSLPVFQLDEAKLQAQRVADYTARYLACYGLCKCGRPLGWSGMDMRCPDCRQEDGPP